MIDLDIFFSPFLLSAIFVIVLVITVAKKMLKIISVSAEFSAGVLTPVP